MKRRVGVPYKRVRIRDDIKDVVALARLLLPYVGPVLLAILLLPFTLVKMGIRRILGQASSFGAEAASRYTDIESEEDPTAHVLKNPYTPRAIRRYYPHPRDLRMPTPRSLSGSFYRLHNQAYLSEDQFWKTFLDTDFKWKQEQRFASRGMNCGHYFGRSPEAVRAEHTFYDQPGTQESKPEREATDEQHVMLEIAAHFPAILDLTNYNTMSQVFTLLIDGNYEGSSYFYYLRFLTDETEAGNVLTKEIGRWAWEHGYDGILFYSARAVEEAHVTAYESARERIEHRANPNLDFTYSDDVETMRSALSIQNLVIFSGACLTGRIAKYRVDDGSWRPNPYHGISLRKYDALLKDNGCMFDSEYQVLQSDGLITVGEQAEITPWSKDSGKSRHRSDEK